MTTKVLVTGATGFIGSRLAEALRDRGHEVRAMTRHPEQYSGAGTAIFGDVADEASIRAALEGVDVAYYLVHSLEHGDFEERDAQAAAGFGEAAAAAGLRRIVYLGGLGRDDAELSPHLRSRRAVEGLLAQAGVPVTVLRAAVVVGHGGISWEITRQLVDHLPVMVAPRWVRTRTQPIALPDVIKYLVGVLDAPEAQGRVFEIGGPDVLRYLDMMKRVAVIQNRRLLPVFTVPLLTPRLSSRWLQFVTDVDLQTARTLIDSMSTEVVVRDNSIEEIVPGPNLSYDEAIQLALDERAAENESERDRHSSAA
jgi:uncharacterized protein YbjT (DUF2867 family)